MASVGCLRLGHGLVGRLGAVSLCCGCLIGVLSRWLRDGGALNDLRGHVRRRWVQLGRHGWLGHDLAVHGCHLRLNDHWLLLHLPWRLSGLVNWRHASWCSLWHREVAVQRLLRNGRSLSIVWRLSLHRSAISSSRLLISNLSRLL